jgi:galactofuranose transport system ATP-binding protein
VVFVSAELEEVVRICDQVVVLRDRHKVAELDGASSSVDDVVDLIARGGRS